MCYTQKDGYREGVIFAFYRNGKLLIENRPVDSHNTQVFITSGSVEEKDTLFEQDYRIITLFREVAEEFQNRIQICQYDYLGELKVPEINILFYIYLITDWNGEFPEYILEPGEPPSQLQWIELQSYDSCFEFESAKEICRRIQKYLEV